MGDPISSINRGYCLLERTGFLLIEALSQVWNVLVEDYYRTSTPGAVLFANCSRICGSMAPRLLGTAAASFRIGQVFEPQAKSLRSDTIIVSTQPVGD
ncbi:hypothetical protein Tco_1361086 [Tanacetum coccineum]